MATLQTQSTTGTPLTVVYPAERPSGQNNVIWFRVGKKTMQPAFAAANLPHLVQFETERRTVMFLLSDILETSYWRKARNAYTWFGQLDVDEDVKVDAHGTQQIVEWLKEASRELGIGSAPSDSCQTEPELAAR